MSKTAPTAPVWLLAWVRQAAALASAPKVGAGTFENSQQVYVQRRAHDKWVLFDGKATYVVLATAQAQAALKSCRDERGQVRLAENQEWLSARLMEAMAAQGSPFICRPRS